MNVVWVLAGRELRRFARQPSRILGALGTPLLFWVFLGSGLAGSFSGPGGGSYRSYFFPGTLALVLLFAGIFGAISLIEDRQQGFLQGVLVAPVSRLAMFGGKVAGGATLAALQGMLLLPLAWLAGVALDPTRVLRLVGALALVAVALAAFGFLCAWRFDSIQGFHAVMNLVLMPMWLLSGAVFPVATAAPWLQWLARVDPLAYGVALLRHASGPAAGAAEPGLPSPVMAATVVVAWAVASLAAGAWLASRPERR